jgi:hypothetical protein
LYPAGTLDLVHYARSHSVSKPLVMRRRVLGGSAHWALVAGIMAPTAWLLAGCGSGGDLISTVALPSQQTTDYSEGVDMPVSPGAGRPVGSPELTPAQHDYLDTLVAAGIHPTSDLRALSIGAYVCQARAAGQSDQTVWDSVAPMVRSDVIEVSAGSPQTPAVTNVDTVVGNVIHIAIQKLC